MERKETLKNALREKLMGIRGYKHPGHKHTVVAVNPDGSVFEVFEFIRDAVAKYGMARKSITNSCKRGALCHGKRWFYEEDFRRIYMNCEIEKLKFELDPNRDPVTKYFVKGHKLGNGHDKLTEEQKQRKISRVREACARRASNGEYKESNKKCRKPVVCLNDGKEFPSVSRASEYYGIPRTQVSEAIHRVGTVRGLKIRLKSQLEKIKEVI